MLFGTRKCWILIAAGRESLPVQLLPVGNLYPNSGKQAKKVENPELACWKSLPKQRKSVEKGRETQSRRPEISTQTAGNSPAGSTPMAPSAHTPPAPPDHIFSIVSSHILLQASLGMRRSPLGEMATEPTLGPSGRQERLNCWLKKRR